MALTNITDYDPATGRTTTTLVSDHDRGSVDYNNRKAAGTPAKEGSKIASLSPTTRSIAAGNFTLTVNGTNFQTGAAIQFDGANLTTTRVNAQQLTATVTVAGAEVGTVQVAVDNGEMTTAPKTFTFTA